MIERPLRGTPPSGRQSNFTTIRASALNIGSLGGKAETLLTTMERLNLDFIFLSETWCRPGETTRIFPFTCWAREVERANQIGHYPYGYAIIYNPRKAKEEDFVLLSLSNSEVRDRMVLTFSFRGILFTGVYIAPQRQSGFLSDGLRECVRFSTGDRDHVILGDMNARHRSFGDSISNCYGEELIDFLNQHGLERIQPSTGKWTFLSGNGESIIDHIIVNDNAVSLVENVIVHEEIYFGSDHRLISIEIKQRTIVPEIASRVRPWNRLRMKEEHVLSQARQYMQQEFNRVQEDIYRILEDTNSSDQLKIDNADAKFNDFLKKTLKRFIGRTPSRKNFDPVFQTPELLRMRTVVEAQHEAWYRTRSETRWRVLMFNQHILQEAIAKRKKEMFEDFSRRIDSMQIGEIQRTISRIRTKKSRSSCALEMTPDALSRYREFYQNQFTNLNPDSLIRQVSEPIEGQTNFIELFNLPRITEEIKNLAKGKATGDTGIPAEALQIDCEMSARLLQPIFIFSASKQIVPTTWTRSRIQPVPKKGNLSIISNYRPISLTEVTRKLFERLILKEVTEKIEPLSVEQGGFRSNRGCIDQIAALQQWNCQKPNRPRIMAFLDIKAAYDSVDRSLLWDKCRRKGFKEDLIKLLVALFDNNHAVVAVNGSRSEPFFLQSGVLQGSILSPCLYSLFIDDIINKMSEVEGTDATINGRRVDGLLYADDIVLIGHSVERVQSLLEKCQEYALENRFKFNVQKCEVLSNFPMTQNLNLYDGVISNSEEFPYLGCIFNGNGINWRRHFQRIEQRAFISLLQLYKIGCNPKGFRIKTSLFLFRSIVQSGMEYCMALARPKDLGPVRRLQQKALSLIGGIGRGSGNVFGIFGSVDTIDTRWERLNSRFYENSKKKERGNFMLGFAYKEFLTFPSRKSCFYGFHENEIVKSWKNYEMRLAFIERNGLLVEERKTWSKRREELVVKNIHSYKTAFVFQRGTKERGRFIRTFEGLPREYQRAIIAWILNRSVQPWMCCRFCREERETKSHLEHCVFGTVETRPSAIEVSLRRTVNHDEMCRLARLIIRLVGTRRS